MHIFRNKLCHKILNEYEFTSGISWPLFLNPLMHGHFYRPNKSPLKGGKVKFVDFVEKSWGKKITFRYGLLLEFLSKGHVRVNIILSFIKL